MTTIDDARQILASTIDLPAEQVAKMLGVPVALVEQARSKIVHTAALIDAEMVDWRARCAYCDEEVLDALYQNINRKIVHDRCAEPFSALEPPQDSKPKLVPLTPAEYKARQRARAKLAQRCRRCGLRDERTLKGMINCVPCAEHEARRQVGMRRKKKGQCYRCGKKDDRTSGGLQSCWDCADRAQRRRFSTRNRRRTNRR